MSRGRPTKYRAEYVTQAAKLAALGATDREVAEFFDVNEATVHRWKHEHPEFCESLKVGKETADARVEQSLYRRALGYSHDAVKIFMPANADSPVYADYVEHHAPDTTAAIFWLKNRRPDEWRDKRELEHSGGFRMFADPLDETA
jgi:Homeodomain-like domain-containing protein